jgi:rhodanese-related sulfurtransferase
MKNILLTLVLGFTFLCADFRAINEVKLDEAIKKGVVVIDIRRADEWAKFGTIRGSYKLTFFDKFGKYNSEKWMSSFIKLVRDKNQAFVLVCAHANRTKAVGKMLSSQLGYRNVYELEGGINYGWIDKGRKTVK